jgi:hypothetical protein
MALSPADFAAYSQAAGIPYPEDPEERAALTPQVREFRQNQLRQQESSSSLPTIAGLAALGLGAIGLGLAARRGFGGKAPVGGRKGGITLTDLSKADVRDVNVAKIAEPAPSQIAPRSLIPTEAEAMAQYGRQLAEKFPEPTVFEMEALNAPSRTSKILANLGTLPQYRPDPKDINYQRFGPVSKEVAAARREQATQDLLHFAQQRQEDAAIVVAQTIGALESGEDQITGRTMRGTQRNEDLDLAEVNSVARQTGSANVAASMTPDGVPVDQTDLTYFATEKQFLSPGPLLQQRAKTVSRYQTPTPVSLIAKYPASAEDPQNIGRFPGALGTSAEDLVTFTPAHGGVSNVVRRGGLEITPVEGRIAGLPARYTALPAGRLTEGFRFTPASPAVPLTPETALAKLTEFETSKNLQIANAMERGLNEARARRNVQITPSQQEALEVLLPTYSPEDVMSQPGLKAYGDITAAERFTEEMSSKSGRLESLEQGGFLEQQVDPGELRGEPRQVRRGVMISPASKTSYRGVIGRPGYGIYGEQAGGRAGTPVFGAGAVEAAKEIKNEGETRGITTPRKFIPGLDAPETETPEGFVYTEEAMVKPTRASGGYKKYGSQPPTPKAAATESLNVSSELLRLQKEQGPEAAQAFLDKMMEERQISALGSSQPLRQRINRQGRFTS